MNAQSLFGVIGVILGVVGTILGVRSEIRSRTDQRDTARKLKAEAYFGIRRLLRESAGLPALPENLTQDGLNATRHKLLQLATHTVELSKACAAVAPELLQVLLDLELAAKQLARVDRVEPFEIKVPNTVFEHFAALYSCLSSLEFAAISLGDLTSHELRDYTGPYAGPGDHEFYHRSACFDCNAKGIPWQVIMLATGAGSTTNDGSTPV